MRPLTSYLPKPMLPLGKKPVLEYIVKEIKDSGISEILIVTRSDHRAVIDYFGRHENVRIRIDDSAGGPGKAVLEGKSFVGNESFLVVFSDAPLSGGKPEQVIHEMIKVFEKYSADSVLSVYPVSEEEANTRGIVSVEEKGKLPSNKTYHVTDIKEKPDKLNVSNPLASACRYIFTDNIFDALEDAETDENGELQLTAGINVLLEREYKVFGIPLPAGTSRYDTGNFKDYFDAFDEFVTTGKSD